MVYTKEQKRSRRGRFVGTQMQGVDLSKAKGASLKSVIKKQRKLSPLARLFERIRRRKV